MYPVKAADTLMTGYSARIRVEEDYKGRLTAGDTVAVSSYFSNCEINFEVGHQYLLFLHQENGQFFITSCSYSTELDGSNAAKNVLARIHHEFKQKTSR